jgi:hypothetical protein
VKGTPDIDAMSILRTFLVFFLAAAIAMLPVAGNFARANAAIGVSLSAVPADCCGDGDQCGKAMHSCGSMAGCMVKCSGFTASLSAPFTFAAMNWVTERTPLAHQRVHYRPENPLLPPPRV